MNYAKVYVIYAYNHVFNNTHSFYIKVDVSLYHGCFEFINNFYDVFNTKIYAIYLCLLILFS